MAIALTMSAVTPRTATDGVAVIDEARFLALYERTAAPLRRYLARTVGDLALADDLLQDTYVRFLGSGFDGDDARAERSYLYRIATNLARDHFRRGRREVPTEIPEIPDDGGAETRFQIRHDVLAALAGLGLRDRQMLWLAYAEGASHDEIAMVLGLRSSSLRSMLSRARHRLAERLRSGSGAGASR